MNIPDSDMKAVLIPCGKCGSNVVIAVVPFPGTLVSAICPHCMRELFDEAAKSGEPK